jgi:hypothetical protein
MKHIVEDEQQLQLEEEHIVEKDQLQLEEELIEEDLELVPL